MVALHTIDSAYMDTPNAIYIKSLQRFPIGLCWRTSLEVRRPAPRPECSVTGRGTVDTRCNSKRQPAMPCDGIHSLRIQYASKLATVKYFTCVPRSVGVPSSYTR